MKKKKESNISYIKLFVLIILITAFFSISYKAFLLVKNRSFRFNTYNIMLVGQNVQVISLNTQTKQVQHFKIEEGRNSYSRRKPLGSSIATGVPLDGVLISIAPKDFFEGKANDFPTFAQTLSFVFEDEKYIFHNINKFDLIKLFFISKLTNWQSIESDNSHAKFYDTDIFNEKTSIEIINSTEIDGLGTKLGVVLSNLGASVISIKDGRNDKTQIFTRNRDLKTLGHLELLMELKAELTEDQGIADITINLGKDRKWE